MTIYADETFYQESYLQGRNAVITAAFSYYAMLASREIDKYIHSGISPESVPEAVRFCCCELAELSFQNADFQANHGSVASESVQGWSVSYESAEAQKTALKANQKECIYRWLSDTGLLSSGVKPC